MRIVRKTDVEPREVKADREGNPAKGTSIRVLVPEGPSFVMRVLTVKPGGWTPAHAHPWEHEVYVLSGAGRIVGEGEHDIAPGDAVFVPAGEAHSFVNAGDEDLSFICVVPKGSG